MTSYTSGAAQGTLELYTSPSAIPSMQVIQNGTWNVGSNSATGSTIPANAFYIAARDGSGNLAGLGTSQLIGDASTGVASLSVGQLLYNGTNWDRIRIPNTFKTATATASGDTAVWTPAGGKKFRLMRYQIQVTADAAQASGGDIDIILRDASTGLAASFSVYVPGTAGTTFGNTASTGWIDLGNGILSAAANNVLNVNLGAALTAGKIRVVACGTEE
jgi:hypothetical protein